MTARQTATLRSDFVECVLERGRESLQKNVEGSEEEKGGERKGSGVFDGDPIGAVMSAMQRVSGSVI